MRRSRFPRKELPVPARNTLFETLNVKRTTQNAQPKTHNAERSTPHPARGNVIVKQVPSPSAVSTSIAPFIRSTRRFVTASPSPLPS